MLHTDRAALVRFSRDGKARRASGFHVAGRFVLTADHCVDGSDHVVAIGGDEYPATVHMRTESPGVDLAILHVPQLPEVSPIGCARVDRGKAQAWLDCVALGFPEWSQNAAGQSEVAPVDGRITTAEGKNPPSGDGTAPLLPVEITNEALVTERPLPEGLLDDPESPWGGMSGSVLVNRDGLVLGVVRSHSSSEGPATLSVTGLDAIDTLLPGEAEVAALLWDALGVDDPAVLPVVPPPVEMTSAVSDAGEQVVVGQIPQEPAGFVERAAVAELAAMMDRSPARGLTAVSGLPGVGKSQLAAAYARTRIK